MREAAGNPLFLRELARVADRADAALPPHARSPRSQLEVAALPPARGALLQGAAVSGDPFDPELAAAAAELDRSTRSRRSTLVAADLVRPAAAQLPLAGRPRPSSRSARPPEAAARATLR